MAIAQNKLVEKAQKEYEYLTGDEATKRWQFLREKAILDERAAYINGKTRGNEEGKIAGRKEGERAGRKKGEKIAKIETAKAMMKDKVKRELIEKYTGLDKKELEKIFQK